MPRNQSGTDLQFDPEIEATARRLNAERRRRAQQPPPDSTTLESETEREAEVEIESEAESELEPPIMSSSREDSAPKPVVSSSIVKPAIGANNFELKTSLIEFIQTEKFGGSPLENPNEHLNSFFDKSDTIKVKGVTEDAIRLRLFPYSLRGNAKEWLRNCAADSFDTWENLSNAFLQKFFPPEKTAKLRNDITGFDQHEDESLYEAWKRFKELQRQCPHHGIPSYLLVVTFYNAVKPELQMSFNAASEGRLDSMTWSQAKDLIEDMAASTYHWGPSRSVRGSKTGSGSVHMMQTQIDELTQQISQLKASSSSSSAQVCNLCGVQGHDSRDCVSMPMSEQVNALGNRTFDPYSNTYNPGWAHNPRLSYANNKNTQQPPIQSQSKPFNQPPGFHPRPPYQQQQQCQPRPQFQQQNQQYQHHQSQPPTAQQKSSLELMMEQFVQAQGKKNDELTQSITHISNSVAGVSSSVSQLTSSQKMMETQIAQLAQQVSDSSKTQGQQPRKTEENPRGHVLAVTLRSGKELVDPVVPSKSKVVSITNEIVEIIDETADEPEKDVEEAAPKETVDIPKTPQRVYIPPVPFPQRLDKAKLE
ncbi:hypothetical protein RND81_08G118500 [Saponaria officinalis]|uniref:Retrotransposon gag domain-containing protein n=1 Tax=Saponaria officinalis TaxID=3572 RepID=A0AAW1J709_SAPOF